MLRCQCHLKTIGRDAASTGKLIVQLAQGYACTYMQGAKTKMHCFVSCLQTQARLSYHALLIWQSVQEAGGEHKYCLGWLLKTRDKPLIHGVLFLWKSPGGSCISSALPKPPSALCLLRALLFVTAPVMVALEEPHTWNCQLISHPSADYYRRDEDVCRQTKKAAGEIIYVSPLVYATAPYGRVTRCLQLRMQLFL